MKIRFEKGFLKRCFAVCSVLSFSSLTGCLDVYHPFSDIGSQARLLTQNNLPPPRLCVPVPVPQNEAWRKPEALWAQDVTVALLGQSIPATSYRPRADEWWIRLGAEKDNLGIIKPYYDLVDPKGKTRFHGVAEGMTEKEWLAAEPASLNNIALEIAPNISEVLTSIQAQMMQADPQSLINRAARIYFKGISGAPGDGNISLARSFYLFMHDARNEVQESPKDADYIVFTEVSVKDAPAEKKASSLPEQTVSLVWHVTTMDGKEIGAATQLHDVPAHSLDKIWGDAAPAAAQQAAEAVKTIITNYSGRDHKPLQDVVITPQNLAQEQGTLHYIDGSSLEKGKTP